MAQMENNDDIDENNKSNEMRLTHQQDPTVFDPLPYASAPSQQDALGVEHLQDMLDAVGHVLNPIESDKTFNAQDSSAPNFAQPNDSPDNWILQSYATNYAPVNAVDRFDTSKNKEINRLASTKTPTVSSDNSDDGKLLENCWDDRSQSSDIEKSSACTEDSATSVRFKPFQSDMWKDRFNDLVQFKNANGHCCVPSNWREDPSLAQWVKRQRHQYKLKLQGNRSTMTDERKVALEELGFIWNSQEAVWESRFNELAEYKQVHGHFMVPTQCPENPQLAVWAKFQRRQLKLYFSGQPSGLSKARALKLARLGVVWKERQPKTKRPDDNEQT